MKASLPDYTESEFVEFVEEIFSENSTPNDKRLMELLEHFENIIGHPAGSDLIYYPESGKDDSAEEVVAVIVGWRVANGLPGFKS